jgi:hypothetical protein
MLLGLQEVFEEGAELPVGCGKGRIMARQIVLESNGRLC